MNENELKSIERYFNKFNEDAASFNEFEANDFIKLLKCDPEHIQANEQDHHTHQQLYDLCSSVVCFAAVDFLNKPYRSSGHHDQRAMPDRIKQHQQNPPKQVFSSCNNGKQGNQNRR